MPGESQWPLLLNLSIDFAVLTKVNANGTVVNLVRHGCVFFICASIKSERNEVKLKNGLLKI